MTNTIETDKLDIRYFAEAYEMLMRMERSGSSFHMGSHGPRNVLNTYLRLSEKLGVRLMNDHFLELVEKFISDDEARKLALVHRLWHQGRLPPHAPLSETT